MTPSPSHAKHLPTATLNENCPGVYPLSFDSSVFEYAKELAESVSPRSVRIMKEQIYNAQRETIEENLESSMKKMVESFDTEDFKEGVAHFIEKREANFTGK